MGLLWSFGVAGGVESWRRLVFPFLCTVHRYRELLSLATIIDMLEDGLGYDLRGIRDILVGLVVEY